MFLVLRIDHFDHESNIMKVIILYTNINLYTTLYTYIHIYIYIYIYLYIYKFCIYIPLRSSFDMSCIDELSDWSYIYIYRERERERERERVITVKKTYILEK